jgi:hypothetical protein
VLHFAAVRDGLQPIGPEVPRLLRQLAAEIEMRNGFVEPKTRRRRWRRLKVSR